MDKFCPTIYNEDVMKGSGEDSPLPFLIVDFYYLEKRCRN